MPLYGSAATAGVLFSGDEDALDLGSMGPADTIVNTSAGWWQVEHKADGQVDRIVMADPTGAGHGQVIFMKDTQVGGGYGGNPRLQAWGSAAALGDATISYDMYIVDGDHFIETFHRPVEIFRFDQGGVPDGTVG